LQSSTARAVVFSALTTMSAFGSLALSNDPGTAGMGELLTISLASTLFCTLLVLPALLGPAPAKALAPADQPSDPSSPSADLIRRSTPGPQPRPADGRVKPGQDG
jgi:uncharacterized membrane protein YdfJ with MMPL/SSD domain